MNRCTKRSNDESSFVVDRGRLERGKVFFPPQWLRSSIPEHRFPLLPLDFFLRCWMGPTNRFGFPQKAKAKFSPSLVACDKKPFFRRFSGLLYEIGFLVQQPPNITANSHSSSVIPPRGLIRSSESVVAPPVDETVLVLCHCRSLLVCLIVCELWLSGALWIYALALVFRRCGLKRANQPGG